MESKSKIKRFRSQMKCEHDDDDREIAVMADGMCPLCMEQRIKELERQVQQLRGEFRAERQEYSKEKRELKESIIQSGDKDKL